MGWMEGPRGVELARSELLRANASARPDADANADASAGLDADADASARSDVDASAGADANASAGASPDAGAVHITPYGKAAVGAGAGGRRAGLARVVVVGVAGGGKSTVAGAVGERLGVPHVELDALFWQAGWTKLGEDEFAARVEAATAAGGWVVDGNYSARIRRIAWGRADLVVWVDLPRAVVMWQLVRRTVRRTVTGVELWNGNRERPLRDQLSRDPSRSILLWAWRTYGPTKREYEMVDQAAFPRVRFIRLRSRR